MVCKRCQQRGKTWVGDDPICAFTNPSIDYKINTLEYAEEQVKIVTTVFNSDNWNCATMNALREVIYEEAEKGKAWYYRNDLTTASIGVLPFETDNYTGNLILTWYKERGETGNAIIMWDDERRELTEDIADEILKQYGK